VARKIGGRRPHREEGGRKRPEPLEPERRADRPPPLDKAEGERVLAQGRAAVEAAGYSVITGRVFPNWQIKIMIEGPEGATVTVGDCERASRALTDAIRAAGHDPGLFEIDVESPGTDRPLTREADFERFKGQQVTVTLYQARPDGRRNFTGPLVAYAAGDVTVHVLDTPEPETFVKADIREVRLHPDMKLRPNEPGPRHGGRKPKRR
jgi:ribosome maturation factor RimP